MTPWTKSLWLNFVLFQVGWFACVLLASLTGALIGLALVTLHLIWLHPSREEALLVAAGGAVGTLQDTLLMHLGFIRFSDSAVVIPLWLTTLWLLFACTLNHSLGWMSRHLGVAALAGGVFGPLAYYGGSRLGALEFGSDFTFFALALAWAVVCPLLLALNNIIKRGQPQCTGA